MQVLGCETKSFCAEHHAEPNPWVGRAVSEADRHPFHAHRYPTASGLGGAYMDVAVRWSVTIEQAGGQAHHLTPGLLRNAVVPRSPGGRRVRENSQFIWIWRRWSPVLWGLVEAPERGLQPTDKQVRRRAFQCVSLCMTMVYRALRRGGFVCGPSWGALRGQDFCRQKADKKRPDFFWVSWRFRLTFIGQSGTLMVSVR